MTRVSLSLQQTLMRSPELHQALAMIQTALNKLSDGNFPDPLTGDTLIKAGSLSLSRLAWTELPIALVLPAEAVTTTAELSVGGYWVFDPDAYPAGDDGTWYFEAALKIDDGGETATATLKADTTTLTTVTTQETDWVVVRSTAVTMPTESKPMMVSLQASGAATAFLGAARMIYLPQG